MIGMKYKLIIFYYFWFLTKDADIRLDARGDLGAIQSHSFLRNRDWGGGGRKANEATRFDEETSRFPQLCEGARGDLGAIQSHPFFRKRNHSYYYSHEATGLPD